MRSRVSSHLIFSSYVGYFDRVYDGFYVTSSRTFVLIDGTKSDSCATQCVYKQIRMWLWIRMRPYLYWLNVTLITTAVWGGINDHALLGESGKLSLAIGHKIWVVSGGSGEWSIVLPLFRVPRGGWKVERVLVNKMQYVSFSLCVGLCNL